MSIDQHKMLLKLMEIYRNEAPCGKPQGILIAKFLRSRIPDDSASLKALSPLSFAAVLLSPSSPQQAAGYSAKKNKWKLIVGTINFHLFFEAYFACCQTGKFR